MWAGAELARPNMASSAHIVETAKRSNATAAVELLPHVYCELRSLAQLLLSHEAPGQTIDSTALVHEAYLRLNGRAEKPQWQSRAHFVMAAAKSMRRVLIDRARAKGTQKRGKGRCQVPLIDSHCITDSVNDDLALDEVLHQLASEDAQLAQLVRLRFFDGLTMPQVATALGVSLATAQRWWGFARAWLQTALSEVENSPAMQCSQGSNSTLPSPNERNNC